MQIASCKAENMYLIIIEMTRGRRTQMDHPGRKSVRLEVQTEAFLCLFAS